MSNVAVNEVLTRGVSGILPNKNDLVRLMSNRKIKLYCGYDPTAPSLHIGHFITARKLGKFQKLGHKVIFLLGDFTGRIGDPTDKSATRKKLTKAQISENLKSYKKQVSRVINFEGKNAAKVMFNSHWLAKLSFEDVIELAAEFTVQQMIERDFFRERLKKNKPVYLHEFLYPMMQGYDSVAMGVDLEIGGNDQLFNMMAGRMLSRSLKNKEKYVLTMKILEDPGGKKMGKTEGNAIFLTDSPDDIYGKIMSVPDGMNALAVELLTDLPLGIIEKESPMEVKKHWAMETVSQIYGMNKAKLAQQHFEASFQKDQPEFSQVVKFRPILSEVVAEVSGSSSKAKRLIRQGAVDVDGTTTRNLKMGIKGQEKIKIGKKIFIRVKQK